MNPDKAPAYWPTRILLAVAIIATAIAVPFALWSAFWELSWELPASGGGNPSVLQLPPDVVRSVLAVGLPLLCLVWVIRIFRGPRDEPPPWRYRDR